MHPLTILHIKVTACYQIYIHWGSFIRKEYISGQPKSEHSYFLLFAFCLFILNYNLTHFRLFSVDSPRFTIYTAFHKSITFFALTINFALRGSYKYSSVCTNVFLVFFLALPARETSIEDPIEWRKEKLKLIQGREIQKCFKEQIVGAFPRQHTRAVRIVVWHSLGEPTKIDNKIPCEMVDRRLGDYPIWWLW